MIGIPPDGDAWLTRLAGVVREGLVARREPQIIGSRLAGTTWHLRFLAALSTPYVQVHLQSTAAGEGGVASYDPDNFTSSVKVDCREDRLQDQTLSGLTVSEEYVVFLIPIQVAGDGTEVKYDGEGGRSDHMAFDKVSP